MSKRLIVGIGMVAVSLVFLIAVLFFSRHAIKREINEVRAERLYGQAAEAFAEDNLAVAARKGTAAHYLDPDNEDIQVLVARALLKQRDINAIIWWERILDSPDLPVDELRQLTELMIRARRIEQAMPFLERLVDLDSGNPETQRLWLEALHSQRFLSTTYQLANSLVKSGSEDWTVHRRFLQMQQVLSGGEGLEQAVEHLKSLIDSGGSLALPAARDLARMTDVSAEKRLIAAEYLEEQSEELLDRILAGSVRVQAGMQSLEGMDSLITEYLNSDDEDRYENLLEWSLWMDHPEIALERIDWETYREAGGQADIYFQSLMNEGAYNRLLEITQSDYLETDPEAIAFLVFRAAAQRALGMEEDAEATLEHSVEVVSPDQSFWLERFLMQDQRWELLENLYENLLQDNFEDADITLRYLASLYYTGNQDKLMQILPNVKMENFENEISALSFVAYLKLVVLGFNPEIHRSLESLLSEYAEVFDFRLIVGVSYLMQGNISVAREFNQGMPELGLNSPRYLRVCSAVLTGEAEGQFNPGELQYLLPKERFLISQFTD